MTEVTDELRREVAAKLRELPVDMHDVRADFDGDGIDTRCEEQADYYQIHDTVLGMLPCEHMHPCDYEELHERLAALIDRPEEA